MILLALVLTACSTPDARNLECVDVLQLTDVETADGDPAGVSYCWSEDPNEGSFDRETATACSSDLGLDWCDASSDDTTTCATDADCSPGWSCLVGEWYDDYACGCVHTCNTDSDCGAGEACLCAAGLATEGGSYLYAGFRRECKVAACLSDADCDGNPCGISKDVCNWGVAGLYCRTGEDECRVDSDCTVAGTDFCQYDGAVGHWTCRGAANCE